MSSKDQATWLRLTGAKVPKMPKASAVRQSTKPRAENKYENLWENLGESVAKRTPPSSPKAKAADPVLRGGVVVRDQPRSALPAFTARSMRNTLRDKFGAADAPVAAPAYTTRKTRPAPQPAVVKSATPPASRKSNAQLAADLQLRQIRDMAEAAKQGKLGKKPEQRKPAKQAQRKTAGWLRKIQEMADAANQKLFPRLSR